MSLRDLIQRSSKLPRGVWDNLLVFDNYIACCHRICHTILACLSDSLGLEGVERFEESHRDGERTNSTLMLMHYPKDAGPANVGQNKHTDLGSLTLILCDQWGLQVMSPKSLTWCYVEPRPGYGVVNVGDTLRFLSGKRLYSALHRVLRPNWQTVSRNSLAYFFRAGDTVKMKDADGKETSVQEWHDEKFKIFREPPAKQAESTMLSGGMEVIIG